MPEAENKTFRVKTDGFFGELFLPSKDKYPGKALICFSGSDGGMELARTLAGVFKTQGLTTLALLAGSLLPELVNAVIAKRASLLYLEAVGVFMEKKFLILLIKRRNFHLVKPCAKVSG